MEPSVATTTPIPSAAPTRVRIIVPELNLKGGHIQMRRSHPLGDREQQPLVFTCRVDVAPGLTLAGYMSAEHPNKLYIQPVPAIDNHYNGDTYWGAWHITDETVDPFFTAEVIGKGEARQITRPKRSNWGHPQPGTETVEDTYDHHDFYRVGWHNQQGHGYGHKYPQRPWIYLKVKITHANTGTDQIATFRVPGPDMGTVDVSASLGQRDITIEGDFFGFIQKREYHCHEWADFQHLLTTTQYTRVQSDRELWTWWFEAIGSPKSPDEAELASVKSMWTRKNHLATFSRLKAEEPLLYRFLLWLHDKKTQDGTSNNKLLAAFFMNHAPNYATFVAELHKAMDEAPTKGVYVAKSNAYGSKVVQNRLICLGLPGADERERERREKKEWSFREGAKAQAESLGLDPARHPKMLEALEEGHIPMSLFHEPGDKDHLINIEFDLWEEALSQEGWAEVLYEIAQAASSRSTFSKRVTSYISFLFHLPRYLDDHAKRPGRGKKAKWRAMPVFVKTESELEMEEATENGTVKTRSALTPVADNENGVVTVPYAAIQMHGFGTTYCYSDHYFVARAGLNDPNGDGVFYTDLEEKLNGRDDYGLMWYTLMGTERNTGYPSFLVIFERLPTRTDLNISTRVHFHRVHPNRSKKGIPTPTVRLIRECYRYMAGNVTVEEIHAQQGDLIFIRVDKPGKAVEEPVAIASFESHAFVPLTGNVPVKLISSVAKSPTNRLGYLYSETGFRVEHPEHEDIEKLEAGWFEIRRCKSFEASPSGVWSYTFD